MKRKLKDFVVKFISLSLAITMAVPTNVYALGLNDRDEQMPTMIRQKEVKEKDKGEENESVHKLDCEADLNEKGDRILAKIKVSGKNPADILSIAINHNQAIKDLHLKEVKNLQTGEDIAYEVEDAGENSDLKSLAIKAKQKGDLEYTIEAIIDKEKIDTKKVYSFDLSLDQGSTNLDLRRISYKFIEEEDENDPEVKNLILSQSKEGEDSQSNIAYTKNDDEDKDDTLTYTDYLISKDKGDEKSKEENKNEVTYKLAIDKNQDPNNGEITLEYYKAGEKGFTLQKEFSTQIPYQEETKLDLPQGYLLKLTYTNRLDKKNTKIEKYSVNAREVKNPRFVKEEEKQAEDKEDPARNKAEENKKKAHLPKTEAKAEEKTPSKEEKDKEDKNSEELVIDQNSADDKEVASKPLEQSKEEKDLSKKEQSNQTQLPANKKGLNQNQTQALVDNFTHELEKQKQTTIEEKPSKKVLDTIKGIFGKSSLQKADKDLKKALADKKNGLEDIQRILTELGNKYDLSRADQAKLMEDNEEAIKNLIARDADENFRPHMFAVNDELNLDGKKFNIITRFQTSNVSGPIQPYQYFDIHLDPKLTVKNPASLEDIIYQGRVIAKPTYIEKENKIRYQIQGTIPENIQVPINIPVDYNTKKIKLDNDGTFTVTNKVSGMGIVNPPKDLIPQKVDKDGNLAGSIIEPDRGDVPEIIEAEDKSYKVDMDAYGTPVVNNGVLEGFNWKATVLSTVNLKDIDLSINFTTVKGSGLGVIQNLTLDGVDIDKDKHQNDIKGKLGIVDSVNYKPTRKDGKKFTYSFYTPVTKTQESYMLDLNAIANGKVGAKRVVGRQGYPTDKVANTTPNRVGMNNRTSILGEFPNNTQAKWTITDQVSTGDDGKLPLVSRKLSGNQKLSQGRRAIYAVDTNIDHKDTYGKMIKVGEEEDANPIPKAGENPPQAQPVGSIVAYEYITDLKGDTSSSLGGVRISKTQDLRIDQNWGLDDGARMPDQTIKARDPVSGDELGKVDLGKGAKESSGRQITIPNVKVWNIDADGKATRILPKIDQGLPKEEQEEDGKTYQYLENYNYYQKDLNQYYIHNIGIEKIVKKYGNFTLVKIDKETKKPIEGARFRLTRGPEVYTNVEGKAEFSNIEPGSYTLIETKAPLGYRLAEDTTITVDKEGRVRSSGPNSSQKGDETATQYFNYPRYPLFMNIMAYSKKENDGKVTAYLYLKPDEGGGTNQNTRLNIRGFQNDLTVEVFDVSPSKRPALRKAMETQSEKDVEKNKEGSVLNEKNSWASITGYANVYESYTGETGYQIKIPHERFGDNWGFLVKVNGTPTRDDKKVSYDWLVDNNDPGNNARIQKTIAPLDPSVIKETQVIVTNEKFKTKPVQVIKVDSQKRPLGGASFVLKDAEGNPLKTVTSNDKEGEDKGKADFGEMPPGNYVIEELSSPTGYVDSQLVFDVTVDEKSQVFYAPRFKNNQGKAIHGKDYWIEDEIVKDEEALATVIKAKQSMTLDENKSGGLGEKKGVWEAYRYESYTYKADITLENVTPNKRFEIQFDKNLDFTQYVNKIPDIVVDGKVVAKQYFNYETNLLTYVFNDEASGRVDFSLSIVGVIPSKFYAQNSGIYHFTNVVAPGEQIADGNQTDEITVNAFYEDYDSPKDGNAPTQAYYFRDVYQGDDGNWYVKALAYYNPTSTAKGERQKPRSLFFNWMSTNWTPSRINDWSGNGNEPAFALEDVKIYYVQPTGPNKFQINNRKNMPLSMGIIPENDPITYQRVYSQKIDPKAYISNRQGNIGLTYDPSQITRTGRLDSYYPLVIDMPRISDTNEGYVIEQTFKVTDLHKFRNMFRAFYMANSKDKSVALQSAFASKVNANDSAASQIKKEIPKFYKQKIMMVNEPYIPTSFKIRKYSQADKNKTLKGAVFSLKRKDGHTVARTTDSKGELTFDNLLPGTYTLKETKAPDNYNLSDKIWQVNVSKDGYVTISEIGFNSDGTSIVGKDLVLDVANKPKGQDFVVYKKGEDGKPLAGATFIIKKKDSEDIYAIGKSDGNGVVKFKEKLEDDTFKKLENGVYILEEQEAPTGYKKLDKKWVLVVGDKGVEVHDYIQGPKEQTNETVNKSLLVEKGTKWVNVLKRPLGKFNGLQDVRWKGYVDDSSIPYKMGTRIIGINRDRDKKYVIQRFVINPEARSMGPSKVQIHRQPLSETNIEWYKGDEAYKIFELDKAVTSNVEDIRLEHYVAKELKNISPNQVSKPGEIPKRMEFNLPKTDKPIIIDVKVPYENESGGVGLGMDYWENVGTANEKVYWKPDYYEEVSDIVEGDEVSSNTQAGNIIGAYVSEGSLDLTNERNKHEFEFKKIREKELDGLSGATFKLTGTKPSTDPKWGKSDADGKVKFKDLLPGTYHLEEEGAPQGYEAANTTWTVTIKEDGKVYIKDDIPTSTVPNKDPESKWQKVRVGKGEATNQSVASRDEYKQIADQKIKTNIVEVNLATNRMRQVFLLNRFPERLENPTLEIHSQPESRDITSKNTKVISIHYVNPSSEPDKLVDVSQTVPYKTEVIHKNNHDRLKINTKAEGEKPIEVTIETDIPKEGIIGTGMDYTNITNGYWAAESYANRDKFALDPIPDSKVDKTSKLIIDGKDRSADAQSMLRMASEENPSLLSKENGILVRNFSFRSLLSQDLDLSQPLAKLDLRSNDLRSFRSLGLKRAIAPRSMNVSTRAARSADVWEKVYPDKSTGRADVAHSSSLMETKITEINKGTNRFKQVFLYKEESASKLRLIEIHRQPENDELRLGMPGNYETYVNVYKVNASTIDQALNSNKTKISVTTRQKEAVYDKRTGRLLNPRRIAIDIPAAHRGYILVEVEAKYTKEVGLGSDYEPNTNQQYDKTRQWVADSYSSESTINDKVQEPTITYQNRTEETKIPFTKQTVYSDQYPEGESQVTQKGVDGKVIKTYRQKFINGRFDSEELIDTQTTQPTPEITTVGTKKPQQQTFKVNTIPVDHGSVTAQLEARVDEEVKVNIKPDDGYVIDKIEVLNNKDGAFIRYVDLLTGTFTMPAQDVALRAHFKEKPQAKKYPITTSVLEGKGTLTVDPTSQEEGKPVTITVKADSDYEIGQVTANGKNIVPLLDKNGQYTFNMEAKPVNVIATFNKKEVVPKESYYVGVDNNNNGKKVVVYTRTESGKSEAGKLVEFTVTPDDDYEITSVYVRKSDGSGQNVEPLNKNGDRYSFTMPNQAVTIYANVQYVQPPQGTYLVGINPKITGGSVKTEPRRPYPNDKVRIIATPNQGNTLESQSLSVTKQWGGSVDVQYDDQGPYFIMPNENVTVNAKFKEGQGPGPNPNPGGGDTPGGGSQVLPDSQELGYLIYDPATKTRKDAKITNKKAGLELSLFKKDTVDRPLEGGEFKLIKTDEKYETQDKSFTPVTAVSDNLGKITFRDDKDQLVKLQTGYYVLEELRPPLGYKKASSKWKIEVRDDEGRMHATYFGPTKTPSQYLESKESKLHDDTLDSNLAIRTASKITHIDPDSKTFVQRIIVDLRGYTGSDKVNVQIMPKHKRDEKDRPKVAPDTIKEGLKTAYRTTYKISDPAKNLDVDYILGYYDLSKDGVSMVNTARWRPYDWGFDEDQLNLDKGGVYFIDIEGYYDESLITGIAVNEKDVNGNKIAPHKHPDLTKDDLAKLEMDVKFYQGERVFQQAIYDESKPDKIRWESFPKASYQAGASELAKKYGKAWSNKPYNEKYENWVGRDGGRIWPDIEKATPAKTLSTSADISSLYTTDKEEDKLDIPKDGLEIVNDEESYNITFSKHGRDGDKTDPAWASKGKLVTENRLEGAIFKLQQLVQNSYVDLPGSYVSSAFNGFFGFRGLKPGRYRLMEVQAPKGYRPIKGAILYMTIDYEKPTTNVQTGEITKGRGVITLEYDNGNGIIEYDPEKSETVNEGKLVDYVTSATAKNMGKIINEKPGKGKITITKKDDENKLLSGAKFKLTRLSRIEDPNEGPTIPKQNQPGKEKVDAQYVGEVDENGKLVFDQLPIGQYKLEEIEPAPGHTKTGQIWYFVVGGKGLDPYTVPEGVKGNDVSSLMSLSSKLSINRPGADEEDTSLNIYPNRGDSLSFQNTFKVKDNAEIKPGDFFKVKLTDGLNLHGIYKADMIKNLDIFADGVGTIAKGSYDSENGEITYTFTDYAKTYTLRDLTTNITAYIDPYKVTNNQNLSVAMHLENQNNSPTNVNVIYDLGTEKVEDKANNNLNLSSRLVSYDPRTGEFEQYIYINRLRQGANGARLTYYPDTKVDNLRIDLYRVKENQLDNLDNILPPSYGINPQGLTYVTGQNATNNDGSSYIVFPDGYPNKNTVYLARVTGRVSEDKSTYNPRVRMQRFYNGNIYMWAERENHVYSFVNTNTGTADVEVTAINPKNRISFKKVDPTGYPLAKAEFKLVKFDGSTWKDVKNSEKTSDEKGLVSYDTLEQGTYGLVETKAPEGFTKLEGPIEIFEVSKDGKIVRLVDKPSNKQSSQTRTMLRSLADGMDNSERLVDSKTKIAEPLGKAPIEIVDPREVKFKKVNKEDKGLSGAVFEVYYKNSIKDTYKAYRVIKDGKETKDTLTIKSSDDGAMSLSLDKPGYYALKEIKAPEGYDLPKLDFVKEFRIVDGKVQVKDGNKITTGEVTGDKGLIKAEVYEINNKARTFKERLIINPDHGEFSFDGPDTQLRFLEDNWKVINDRKVRVAVLDEGENLDNLKEKSYREVTGKEVKTYIESKEYTLVKYKLQDLYGAGNYTGPERGKSKVTTKKALVVEIEGQLKEGQTSADLQTQIHFDFTTLDEITYKLDTIGKPNYVDLENEDSTKPEDANSQVKKKPIRIVNEKTGIYFKKVSEKDKTKPLSGASFTIEKLVDNKYQPINKEGEITSSPDSPNSQAWIETSDKDGLIRFEKLANGKYLVKEIKPPIGYEIGDEPRVLEFEIKEGKVYRIKDYRINKSYSPDSSGKTLAEKNEYENSKDKPHEVTNKLAKLPLTAGPGVWIGFAILGALLMSLASIYLAKKQKEDAKKA
ncbi:SpaA isopeptide-forming pilin-related protein [uncultured Anaerococcus sp.]|uniref:SpaA isopeptide-forming pilin-related protein n=1 Tax=uncultured Anaerococcus sp. TaxID=293428 RepID=UPI00288C30A7|nr:SpaA isopeptide-forming pilin-related protein [uncultured Anaerococcus sp.]